MNQASINTAPLAVDPGSGQTAPGVIYAANDSRFVASQYNMPLTAFSVGWNDPSGVTQLLDRLFPVVEVPMRFSWKKADNGEAYLSETDDVRAIGSAFKRVEFSGSEVQDRCYNKGLTVRLDYDEYPDGQGWEERFTAWLLQRLARNEVRRGIAILDAASTNIAKTWNATANPDGDIRAALRAAKADGGYRPNTLAWGGAAWDARANSYEANTTNSAYAVLAEKTPEQIRQKFMLEQQIISESVYTTKSGDAATKTEVIGLLIYAYWTQAGLMKDDASNLKRFVYPTPAGRTRVYVEPKAKFREITVEHYSNIVATSTLGIRKLTITSPF